MGSGFCNWNLIFGKFSREDFLSDFDIWNESLEFFPLVGFLFFGW